MRRGKIGKGLEFRIMKMINMMCILEIVYL